MAKDDSDDIRIRSGRSRGTGRRANPRDLPFTRQVELAVRRAGGNPGRIGRGGAGRKGGSGRFNAQGRGAKALALFPRDSGGWQRDSIGRFRSRRVVVKARVVKLAPPAWITRSKVRGVNKAADAHLRYLEREGVTRDSERGHAYSAFENEADGRAFIERRRDDRHQFRLIVAQEDAAAIAAPAASASYVASYAYDALNRPITVTWTPAATQTTPGASSGVTFAHAFDANNRRIGQSASDNSWWSYPAATAVNLTYTANNLNQYSAVGSVTPTYDGNGNLTYDGSLTYSYDAESRLTQITQGSTTLGAYAYDAQGRRKSKTAGGATTLYVTDADNRAVLEYDGTSGALEAWYAFGGGGVLNRMNVAAASRQTTIPDIQGSIIGTLDSGGTLSKDGYQPFGENPTTTTGSYRYTGQRIDPETGGSASQPSGLYGAPKF